MLVILSTVVPMDYPLPYKQGSTSFIIAFVDTGSAQLCVFCAIPNTSNLQKHATF